jgi:hypothetical protein
MPRPSWLQGALEEDRGDAEPGACSGYPAPHCRAIGAKGHKRADKRQSRVWAGRRSQGMWLHERQGLRRLPIIPLLPFPPKSPELNPIENIWQFMRDISLSNRIFKFHEDILDHCCFAWTKLIDMPWNIMSIGIRDWAYRS